MAKNYKKKYDPEAQKEKLDGVLKSLENGIKNMWSSDEYRNYLKTLSKFHKYSINNSMLIRLQMPEFTRVGSYTTWNRLGRQVLKGSKGIQILQPSPYTVKGEVDRVDPQTGAKVVDSRGVVQKDVVETKKMNFKLTSIFDISQTQGRELPSIAERLQGNGQKYDLMFDAISTVSPYPVYLNNTGKSGGNFVFNQTSVSGEVIDPHININETLDRQHQVKTLIHEITHAEIHADSEGKYIDGLSNNLREVQAESVAYVVCEHFGIDSSQYSFGYIGNWASNKELPELKESLNSIREKASDLITRIENEIEAMLDLERGIRVEILENNSNSKMFPVNTTMSLDNFYELYSSDAKMSELLKNGIRIGNTVSDGDITTIRVENLYDCHFKAWDFNLDELNKILEEALSISDPELKNNFNSWVTGDKVIFENLNYEQFAIVDRISKENNSILFVDEVKVNQFKFDELAVVKIMVSTPNNESIIITLDSKLDSYKLIAEQFKEQYDIDLIDLDWTYKQTQSDYSYFEVKDSNLEYLSNGIYTEKMFELDAKDEAIASNYENAKGTVYVHYRNSNGVYTPMTVAIIDLSKDLNTQINELIPDFESNKVSFYKDQIKFYLKDEIKLNALETISDSSIKIIGKTVLEASGKSFGEFDLNTVKSAIKSKISIQANNISLSSGSDLLKELEQLHNELDNAFDDLDRIEKSVATTQELSV